MSRHNFVSLSLTRREMEVWQFIQQFIASHGFSPTLQEIADGMAIQSRGVVYRYLKSLATSKLIELEPNKRRNIRLVSQQSDQVMIVGKIAAGQPIEAIEEQEPLDISHVFLGEGRYALKVVGDSMVEEGIFDGDIVVCEKAQRAEKGQIAVVLIDQSWATLKKVYWESTGQVLLVPANVNHEPQIYEASRVTIQGIFIGLLRIASR